MIHLAYFTSLLFPMVHVCERVIYTYCFLDSCFKFVTFTMKI